MRKVICGWALVIGCMAARVVEARLPDDRPNLIFILADDLGYGELGCYGQKVIRTPHLDRMAAEGLRFTQFYAGATVCAPSRSVLMTGRHHGHTRVRGNAGRANPVAQALREEDITVAEVLQSAGYSTALIGKWGLGDVGAAECGLPNRQGFDEFFGYLNQQHAHNHFPDFLWRNETRVSLPNTIVPVGDSGGGYSTDRKVWADDLLAEEAVQFVQRAHDRPFFLFWSLVSPHANNERAKALQDGTDVPDFGDYADQQWSSQDKGHAAMVSRVDAEVGRMLQVLRDTGLDRNTLVLFSSDNGPHNESRHDLARFQPSGPFTGIKRSLTEGGIRVPCIAWGPDLIVSGKSTPHIAYFGDWMATAAELAGAVLPPELDSISFVPALRGAVPAVGPHSNQPSHEFLYWEFHEGGFQQAALWNGRWKGLRVGREHQNLRVYDLQADPAEQQDVAASEPDVVAALNDYLDSARSESADWPVASSPRNRKQPE
jgi:arylsulfatase A-like enzyme